MKKTFLTILSSLAILSATSAKEDYGNLSTTNIAPTLKTGAHAVYRYDSTDIQVLADNKIKYTRNYAITILDEKGQRFASFVAHYNKAMDIDKMDAILLDGQGKELKTLKNRDITDVSSYSGTVYNYNSDSRAKIYDFQHRIYPYTIIFKLEKTIKSTFFIPEWEAAVSEVSSVQATSLSIQYPANYAIRYKEYMMPEHFNKQVIKAANGEDKTIWSLENLAALKEQPCSMVENFDGPTILLSPTSFQLYGHEGDLNSWQNMGRFFYDLNAGRDELTPEKIAEVKTLVASEPDTYSKVQKLYRYMQQNTRYVADEYAIAGFQTFEAKDVCKTGYGDCKGLVNYLKALLKAADIKAYTTLVFGGSEDFYKLDRAFPANNFNHVILCVPQAKDSIWVECTDQQLPAGYLGKFTSDRDVLITTKNGGIITHTPIYNESRNFIVRKATMKFDPSTAGNQTIHLENLYNGPTQDRISNFVKTMPEKDVKDMINKRLPFPSYKVEEYNYQHKVNEEHIPSLIETLDADVTGIINSTQKRTFINMSWMRNPMTDIFQTDERTLPIVLNESFVVSDTVMIEMPEGISIEAMPSDKNTKLPFAEYNLHFEYKNNNLILTRKYLQKQGVYDAKLYNEYQTLYQDIEKEKDKLSVVILNKAS